MLFYALFHSAKSQSNDECRAIRLLLRRDLRFLEVPHMSRPKQIITGCRWPMHLHIEALCWFSTVRSIASWPSLLESIVAHSRWMYAAELHGRAGSCLSLAAGLHTGTVVIRCMQSAKAETVAQVCMVAAHASHRDLSSTRFPREPTDNSARVRSRRYHRGVQIVCCPLVAVDSS